MILGIGISTASSSQVAVETAIETKFQDHFVAAMSLPHISDPFPHLKAFLPADRGKPERVAARRARDGAAK
ncbi:MAG: hypothetical protein ACC700_04440 [Anaerolineales bacterium]